MCRAKKSGWGMQKFCSKIWANLAICLDWFITWRYHRVCLSDFLTDPAGKDQRCHFNFLYSEKVGRALLSLCTILMWLSFWYCIWALTCLSAKEWLWAWTYKENCPASNSNSFFISNVFLDRGIFILTSIDYLINKNMTYDVCKTIKANFNIAYSK